jgi:hypothetical protein
MRTPLLLAAAAATAIIATSPLAAQYGGRTLRASLSGRAEAPRPGKLDARGSATVRINPGQTRLCYTLTTRNLRRATMAHIHRGVAGTAGPPVLPLKVRSNASTSSCTRVARGLARDLIRNPRGFYVNVHSANFPDGAIRGQLHS